jgi:hypothetical protein
MLSIQTACGRGAAAAPSPTFPRKRKREFGRGIANRWDRVT